MAKEIIPGTNAVYFDDRGKFGTDNKFLYLKDAFTLIVGRVRSRLRPPPGTSNPGSAPLKFESATGLLTVPESGTMEFYNDRLYITNVALRKIIDRSNDVIVTTTTVVDTIVETTIHEITMPANSYKVGNRIEILCAGQYSTHDASDTCNLNFYAGSTLLTSITTPAAKVTDAPWHSVVEITVRSVGVSGAISVHSDMTAGSKVEHKNFPSITLDTTIAENLIIKAQWSSADNGNSIQIDSGCAKFRG